MARYVARRVVEAVAIVFLVVTLTFFVVRLAPGDPFATAGGAPLPPEIAEQHRRTHRLDDPLVVQYLTFLRNVAAGDFGVSFQNRQPAWDRLRSAIPNTVVLGLAALVVNLAVGVTLGTWQAARAGSTADHALSVVTLALFSIPVFWLALLAIHLFAERLGWLPSGGAFDPATYQLHGTVGKLGQRLRHLVLPATTLGLVGAAWTARYMRSAMLEVVSMDFVRTARAKGLPERLVVFRHAMRNALIPIVTLLGLYLPILLSGAVLVEFVFSWRGLGWVSAEAMMNLDYPVVTGAAVLTAAIVVAGNLVSDLLYRVVDPRTVESP